MANEPTFNPNDIGRVPDDLRRNRAVQDIYEPGSTFKMITATAGLEEGVVWPEKWIDTGNGSLKMGSRVVRDTHAHGTIPFREVIALLFPVQPLCREDCRGLCPHCGVDRNVETCSCPETRRPSPFEVLRGLRTGGGDER
jgi:hypothetical protein